MNRLVKFIAVTLGGVVIFMTVFIAGLNATPCLTSFANVGTEYFELELGNDIYTIIADDTILNADFADLPDGLYPASVYAVNAAGRSAPVHFVLFKESRKNKSYYSITPEEGYEQFFSEPLTMVINTKAGKAIGK